MMDNEAGKGYPDKFGRCAALTIARALQRSGKVFLCEYGEDSREGTAPDDIELEELTTMVEKAKTIGQLMTRRA